MYAVISEWMVSHFGLSGYIYIRGTIIFISGLLFGGLLMSLMNGWIMAHVRPNEKLQKVSMLVVDGQLFTSPPRTIIESMEKRFFIVLYKTGIYRNAISFHNKRRGRILFASYLTIIVLALVVASYVAITLTFCVDPSVTSVGHEKHFLHTLENSE